MNHNELKLEAGRFTTVDALAKEINVLLRDGESTVIILAQQESWEGICRELEGNVAMDRVTIIRLQEAS